MNIDLASVGKVAKPIAAVFEPDEIDLKDENAALKGKAEFTGETQQVDAKAHIRGKIIADLSTGCTRCLEPVERHVDIVFDDVFVDDGEERRVEETEVSLEELDESLVIGGKVDLVEVVREQ